MMKKTSTFLLILSLFVFISPVYADIAPPPAPKGANIMPDLPFTYVRMVSETVLIDAIPNNAGEPPTSRVSASFQMLNMGNVDEAMVVRFPLNLLYGVCELISPYKPIQEFQAWINDQPSIITIDRKVPDNGNLLTTETDCWANFAAEFPVGKDVQIRVSYKQEGGPNDYAIQGYSTFPYVLSTGAGWYGTIGDANIIFRAPWELNSDNLFGYYPENQSQVVGNEIHWHFSDFDPDGAYNIGVTIANPHIWIDLINGRRATIADPLDGEAWGRLGKSLKLLTLERRGIYREDFYRESYAAYQKAVELKPWDADWHFGFSELICSQALYPYISVESLSDNFERDCFKQIKSALDIDPDHTKALKLLLDLTEVHCPECISKYGMESYSLSTITIEQRTETQQSINSSIDATIDLSTLPTLSPTQKPVYPSTPKPSIATSKMAPSPTLQITISPLTSITPLFAQLPTTKATPTRSTSSNNQVKNQLCGSGILPLISIIGCLILKRRLFPFILADTN